MDIVHCSSGSLAVGLVRQGNRGARGHTSEFHSTVMMRKLLTWGF